MSCWPGMLRSVTPTAFSASPMTGAEAPRSNVRSRSKNAEPWPMARDRTPVRAGLPQLLLPDDVERAAGLDPLDLLRAERVAGPEVDRGAVRLVDRAPHLDVRLEIGQAVDADA